MELYLNKFNMVYGRDFKEISLDTFLKNINDNLDNDCDYNYNLYYYGFSNSFSVVYNGLVYDLFLDKNVMENFKMGNYNDATRKIKLLLDKIDGKIITEDAFGGAFVETTEELEIIKKAKKGIFRDSEDKKIYLSYLKESLKGYKGLKNYIKNFKDTLFVNRKLVKNYIVNNVWPFCLDRNLFISAYRITLYMMLFTLICGVAAVFTQNIPLIFLGLLPYVSYLEFPILNLYYAIKKTISRFKNEKNINKDIKQFEQMLELGEKKKIEYKEDVKYIKDADLQSIYITLLDLGEARLDNKGKLIIELKRIFYDYINLITKESSQISDEELTTKRLMISFLDYYKNYYLKEYCNKPQKIPTRVRQKSIERIYKAQQELLGVK